MNLISAHLIHCIVNPRSPWVRWFVVNTGAPWCPTPKSWLTVSPNGSWVFGPHFWVVGISLVGSGLVQLILVYSGSIWYSLVTPRVYQLLLSPGLDKGSPTGCLWWSPMGSEVTHMCHTLRNGLSHWQWFQDLFSRCSRWIRHSEHFLWFQEVLHCSWRVWIALEHHRLL